VEPLDKNEDTDECELLDKLESCELEDDGWVISLLSEDSVRLLDEGGSDSLLLDGISSLLEDGRKLDEEGMVFDG
jgi:hypothetical protein